MTSTNAFRRALIAGCSALLVGGLTSAAAPQLKVQAPGYYRMMLGDFEVTALSDGTNALPVSALLQGVAAPEIGKLLAKSYLAEPVETSFNGFLINTGSKLVLIDTGAGKSMGPGTGHLLANLQAAGYRPEQVDEVYITHFHGDHIGGLLSGEQRSFPNAVIRADSHESGYWLDAKAMATAPKDVRERSEAAMAQLQPYIAAGQFKTFDSAAGGAQGLVLVPGIRALDTRGHTPGHTSYLIESAGAKLLVLGDLVHVGAVQFPRPAVGIRFDTDAKAANAQRAKVFADAAAHGYWIAAAHLSFPGIGHVQRSGAGYNWVPANYGSRF